MAADGRSKHSGNNRAVCASPADAGDFGGTWLRTFVSFWSQFINTQVGHLAITFIVISSLLQIIMIPLEDPAIQVLAGVLGVSFLLVALFGYSRWSAHTSGELTRLLAVLGGSALAFAIAVPSMSMYQLVWLSTLLVVPTAFALFSFEYYGLDFFRTPFRYAAFAAPVVLGIGAGMLLSFDAGSMGPGGRLLTPVMRAQMNSMGGMDAATIQAPLATLLGLQPIQLPAWGINLALTVQELSIHYVSGITLIAVGLFVGSVARYRHLATGLGVSLAFIGFWPWAAYGFMPVIATLFSWQMSLSIIGACYGISLGAVGLAVGRYGLFQSEPAAGNIGPTTVLNEISDPVFVLDRMENVLRLNAAAEATFGVSEREVVGQPLDTALGVDNDALHGSEAVELETADGLRQFETAHSPIVGNGGVVRGETVVLRDITRRQTRRQRLQVLSRVLRHNLRNDMTVIREQAELISDGGVDDPTESADTIYEKSDDLISISERAREAQQILAADTEGQTEADVEAVVTSVHEDVTEQYPAVELSTTVATEATAAVDPVTLETVLRNIVENACEYNNADSPIVGTSVERTDGGLLRIITRDNGPGIPEIERRVVEAGVEDPLEHGSGMGLWTVKWGVAQMGGSITFGEATPRGTVVQLEVPATGN
jgi:signal transduction histidine kinase